MLVKNCSNASSPPAEAPMPTTGKCGRPRDLAEPWRPGRRTPFGDGTSPGRFASSADSLSAISHLICPAFSTRLSPATRGWASPNFADHRHLSLDRRRDNGWIAPSLAPFIRAPSALRNLWLASSAVPRRGDHGLFSRLPSYSNGAMLRPGPGRKSEGIDRHAVAAHLLSWAKRVVASLPGTLGQTARARHARRRSAVQPCRAALPSAQRLVTAPPMTHLGGPVPQRTSMDRTTAGGRWRR